MALRYLTGGESHGRALVAVVDGLPAGLRVSEEYISRQLERRMAGYGRGGRMKIEADRAVILSGVRRGRTMGSPVTVMVENKDHENWLNLMPVGDTDTEVPAETRPRPGHADLAGMLKYGTRDARDVLERASARETAARVAVGSLARRLLEETGIEIKSRVVRIGDVSCDSGCPWEKNSYDGVERGPLRCADPGCTGSMVEEIERAGGEGDTVGGVFEVAAFGVFPGLGSVSQADRRLDARLCSALVSIPAIKAVEVGEGFAMGAMRGSRAHDEIVFEAGRGAGRLTDRAGGIEGGITNGEAVWLRAVMKPIPSLARPLSTFDVTSGEPAEAIKERADVCAVPAASVVGEAVTAIVMADACLEKLGGDSMDEVLRNLEEYLDGIADLWKRK